MIPNRVLSPSLLALLLLLCQPTVSAQEDLPFDLAPMDPAELAELTERGARESAPPSVASSSAGAGSAEPNGASGVPPAVERDYAIQPGDILNISVWREETLQGAFLVRPDGQLSFPLAGEIDAAGLTVSRVKRTVTERLASYIADPLVTVAIAEVRGNTVHVIGKVNKPGAVLMLRRMHVIEALSAAGGFTPFADVDDIKILRRMGEGQIALPFDYGEVERGRNLRQNILLQSGDTIVVP